LQTDLSGPQGPVLPYDLSFSTEPVLLLEMTALQEPLLLLKCRVYRGLCHPLDEYDLQCTVGCSDFDCFSQI